MFKDLVLQNRSYRKFRQEVPIEKETLRELVDLARLSASTSNRQSLKHMLFCDPAKNDVIGLGKPDEKVVLEDVSDGKTMFYWDGDTRRVPKRKLDDVIVASYASKEAVMR